MKRAAPTEIEWQLDALDLRPVERWLAAFPERAPAVDPDRGTTPAVTVEPRPAERLVDTYLDTSDWRMGRSGFVVRVRHRGGQAEVTIKDRAEAKAGLRRRLEVTEPLPTGDLRSLGAEGPVGWRLRALAGKRPLAEVLEVRTRRRPYDLRVSGARVAEVALDDTTIVVGDDHQPVRLQRVEVEVEPDWVEALTPVVETIRRECGLQLATLSKFEAGLLAAGLQVPPPADLGPTKLGADPSVGDVAFAVLRRNLGTMLAHESGTRLGEDVEELHDMRVATRRMRAALSLFSEALPVRARHVRGELGWLADALGSVRDLDVQLERIEEWIADVPEEDRVALRELGDLLQRERRVARDALLTCLDSARYERLVAGFSTMLRQGPSRRSASARAPAVVVVPELVEELHDKATKAARRARRSGDPAAFHRTRIRGKRLRYALEFVAEIYGGQTGKYVRHVVRLQDALGLMQDARVAATQLHDLATAEGSALSPATVFVMGGIAERYRHESERLSERVPDLLDELRGPAWRRLASLMSRRRLERGAVYRWPLAGAPGGAGRAAGAASPAGAATPPAAGSSPDAGSPGAPPPATEGNVPEPTPSGSRPPLPAPPAPGSPAPTATPAPPATGTGVGHPSTSPSPWSVPGGQEDGERSAPSTNGGTPHGTTR
ncbi:MAG TPA: CHAD domain-containing protein [Acidimicrobiales bacterium]|nr:CHAD domain-containing protein [Acidimicrobiales bacterium]